MIYLQHTPITDAAGVYLSWLRLNALLRDGDSSNVIPALCKLRKTFDHYSRTRFVPQKIPSYPPSHIRDWLP